MSLSSIARHRGVQTLGVAVALPFAACSSGDAVGTGAGGAGGADAAYEADASVDFEGGDGEAEAGGFDAITEHQGDVADGPTHPCLSAPDITAAGRAQGEIDPAVGEADYYRLQVTAGELFILYAELSTALPAQFRSRDLTLSVLSADGSTLVATEDDLAGALYDTDDAPTVSGARDPILFHRAAEDATYCVKVEHAWSWAGDTPKASEPCSYTLVKDPVEYDASIEGEPNEDAKTARPVPLAPAYSMVLALGLLEGDDELDVWSLDLPPGDNILTVVVPSSGAGGPGVTGNGSTVSLSPVELTDLAGNVIARTSNVRGQGRMFVRVPGGQKYFLWYRRDPSGQPGNNPFFTSVVSRNTWSSLFTWKEAESSAGANDTPATAETPLAYERDWVRSELGMHGSMHAVATGSPSDIDYWAFEAIADDRVELVCRSLRDGSGVIDATFAIVDESGEELRSEVEGADQEVLWADRHGASAPPLRIETSGRHYVRVSAGGQMPDVSSRSYECNVLVWAG